MLLKSQMRPQAPSVSFADSSLPEGAAFSEYLMQIGDVDTTKKRIPKAFPCEGKVDRRWRDG